HPAWPPPTTITSKGRFIASPNPGAVLVNALAPVKTVFHVKQHPINDSFTNAEVAEDLVEHVFDIDAAGQSAKGPGGVPQFFGDYFLARRPCSALRHGAVQGGGSVLKCAPVARSRYDRCFANRKRFSSELGQSAEQCVEPLAALR